MEKLSLPLTIKVFKEGSSKEAPFVAYNPEFDVSSCGKTEDEARRMLEEAISVTLVGAKEDGTLAQVMQEAGFGDLGRNIGVPKTYISVLNFSLPTLSSKKFSYA